VNIILLSLLAGVAGMGLGGLVTALFGNRTDKMVGIFLSFAGGVMTSVVFLELIPESVEYANVAVTILGLVIGAALVWFLNGFMDKMSNSRTDGKELHENYADFFHSGDVITRKRSLFRSGLVMLVAIGLHNIPEGLALGAAGYHDMNLGITLTIIIGLHNIPEGMAVSAPLIVGGLSKVKSVALTLMIGTTTVVGAVVGVLLGGVSDIAVALSFSVAGGAMLYVVLGEILPQSIITSKNRVPTVFALVGIIVGMLFIAVF
jgi:ZIP family zinc transporter